MLQKKYIGWYLLFLITLFPLIPWALMMPISFRFTNFNAILTSIGQLASLTGIILFSLSFILATRLKVLDKLFNGMNQVYIAHHGTGGIAFILLMMHPLLLAVSFIPASWQYAAEFLLPGTNWQMNLGIIALLLLMALLIITFFIDLPYHLWKWTHTFLSVSFFFGALHAFFIPSDISRNPLLRWYVFIFVGLGLAAYLYRTVLARFFVPKHLGTVAAVKKLSNNVTQVSIKLEKELDFLAGQFVFLQFKGSGVSDEIHPFSLSSHPNSQTILVTAKSLGDFTQKMMTLEIGTPVQIEGPFGAFCAYLSKNNRQVWIAGGIGITPFLSMLSCLSKDSQVDLYYLIRDQDEAVYIPELTEVAKLYPQFRLFVWESSTQGRLTATQIQTTTQDILTRDIFLCGPPAMMHSMKQQLKKLGLKSRQLHTEEFYLK